MFTHYLKITFRNIWKYKAQSLTGIFGLAFAMACFVPALYWMRYETSYDSFQTDAGRLYRVYAVGTHSGKVNEQVPGILARKLYDQIPAVEAATVFIAEPNNCKTEDIPHVRLHTLSTDSTFFRVFPQTFVSGDTQQPLHVLHNIVLTESMAIRLFGDVDKAIGKQIQSTFYFFNPPYTVTAVVKDPLPNTNLPFDALLHHDLLAGFAEMPEELQWIQLNAQMYVKLHDHIDADKLAEELRDYTTRTGVNPNMEVRMLPVADVRHRLNADMPFTLNFIRLFVAAGILLLFSALFNFLNLSLDLFRGRLHEIRQRVVQGAKSRQLIGQMLFETACSILLAMLFGGCFALLARPAFSTLLDLAMDVSNLLSLFVVCAIGIMGLMLLVSLITFWRLSHLATRPLSEGKTGRKPLLRRVAVIVQLAVSQVFLVAAGVVMLQIHYVDNKDLGFDLSGLIQLNGLPPYMERSLRTPLIEELAAIPQVEGISTSNFEPQHNARTIGMISKVDWPGKQPQEEPIFNVIPTDEKFVDTFRLKMLMGQWWKEGEKDNIVLNEEAVRVMALSDPVGTTIRMAIDDIDFENETEKTMKEYKIVGVVKDFHTLSLRSPILPTIFHHTLFSHKLITDDNILYLHVVPGGEQEVIRRANAILPEINPAFAEVRLITLSRLYDNFNYSEQAGLKMFSVLAAVCLLISLFGVYAVATAATRRRRKEIAIRKVSGAAVGDIIRIFFREYIGQVVIAGALALPLAYFAMSRWLQGYAYRTNIPGWLLAGVITAVIVLVLLTVYRQVRKAADGNPSEVVKSE